MTNGTMTREEMAAWLSARKRYESDIGAFVSIIAGSMEAGRAYMTHPELRPRLDRLLGTMVDKDHLTGAVQLWSAMQDFLLFFGTEFAVQRRKQRVGLGETK